MMKKVKKERIKKAALSAAMLVVALIMLYPLIYCFMGVFNTRQEFLNAGVFPLPRTINAATLKNFYILYTVSEVWPSIGVTMLKFCYYAVLSIFVSALTGYLFSKVDFYGKRVLFLYYMISIMIPGIALMVPSYMLLVRFPLMGGNNIFGSGGTGFLDSISIFFVTGIFSAFNMFLMKQSMNTLDSAYKESAEVDGAGMFVIVFRIYLPMVWPIIAVMLIGLFLGTWNDYLFSLIYLPNSKYLHTIGTKIIEIIKTLNMTDISPIPNYPLVFGIALSSMLPPIVVFLIFQRQFISGLTMGGLKG